MYVGVFIYVAVVFIMAGLTTRIPVIIIYGVMLGVGSGLAVSFNQYVPSLMIAIQCYPAHKGLVTGIIVGCFAFGSFIFNFVATYVANPDNLKPRIEKSFGGVTDKYFEEKIAENVPKMFIVLACVYSFIVVCALIMIQDVDLKQNLSSRTQDDETKRESELVRLEKNSIELDEENMKNDEENMKNYEENMKNDVENEEKKEEFKENEKFDSVKHSSREIKDRPDTQGKKESTVEETFKGTFCDALKTRNFYLIFLTTMLAGTAGMFSIASFKVIGLQYGYNDTFLTVVGSLGSVMNGSNRPLWGLMFDKKSYRLTYIVLCIIEVIICFTFPTISKYQAPFLIWLCILYSCSGGTITQLAPISVKLYGKDVGFKVYALLFLSNGFASITVYFIQTYVTLYLDRNKIFYVIGGLAALALVIISFFQNKR
jgi:hypothetical protein